MSRLTSNASDTGLSLRHVLAALVAGCWRGLLYSCECRLLPVTSRVGVDSAFYPPWDGKMSTSQRAVMLCGWGVKAGMV